MRDGKEVVGEKGAVAAWPEEAARIGARIIDAGGNAMDAAAAASLACAVLSPDKNGIGGYVLAAVVLEGKTGRVWSLDANAKAPAAAREDLYGILPERENPKGINENEYGCSVVDDANIHGPLAVAVPGQLAGMGMLWEQWGRLKWPDIVAPCQALVAEGFPYGEELARNIAAMEKVLRRYPASAAHLMPEGRLPVPDDIWHRPDMEQTLRRLAEAGWRDMYEGELGLRIADGVQEMGGILSREDMAQFEPRLSEPYQATYRDARLYGPILPNGCLSSLQILQMLDCFAPVADSTVEYWHRWAEVLKLAWRDRLRYVGDPDFVDVPIERLLSRDYAAGRVEGLVQHPERVDLESWGLSSQTVPETLHLSAADAEGNVVAATITQGGNLGSGVVVAGTGVVLNHGMNRLDPRPGGANSVAPYKRPLNNTAPMIVRLPVSKMGASRSDAAPRDVATGLPGGRRIIAVGAQLAQRVIDFAASPQQAAEATRLHVVVEEPLEVRPDMDEELVIGLEKMGHRIKRNNNIGGMAHIAEYLREEQKTRAGGGGWAAGV
jgi:gamma-glutamyltranspeptidase/glutathione hydrolase